MLEWRNITECANEKGSLHNIMKQRQAHRHRLSTLSTKYIQTSLHSLRRSKHQHTIDQTRSLRWVLLLLLSSLSLRNGQRQADESMKLRRNMIDDTFVKSSNQLCTCHRDHKISIKFSLLLSKCVTIIHLTINTSIKRIANDDVLCSSFD